MRERERERERERCICTQHTLISYQEHPLAGSYLSAEMQPVYSIASAKWA